MRERKKSDERRQDIKRYTNNKERIAKLAYTVCVSFERYDLQRINIKRDKASVNNCLLPYIRQDKLKAKRDNTEGNNV